MSEATPAERREVAAELREEILAALSRLREVMESSNHPPLVEANWSRETPDLEGSLEALRQQWEAPQPGASFLLPEGARMEWIPPHVEPLRRLAWLLGLSDAERAFVDAAASSAAEGKPGEAYEGLMVFADWLEDQARFTDASEVRRLVPESGDVLLVRIDHDVSEEEVRKARAAAEVLHDRLQGFGRDVDVWIADRDALLEHVPAEEMARRGWVRWDREVAAACHELLEEMKGDPELGPAPSGDGILERKAGNLIRRLRLENADLRRVAGERGGEVERLAGECLSLERQLAESKADLAEQEWRMRHYPITPGRG